MKILITGAKGMVGTALAANLKNIKENKNRTRPGLSIEEIYEYDMDSTPEELDDYCSRADFVFHLAGVNRPEDPAGFYEGEFRLCGRASGHAEKAPEQGAFCGLQRTVLRSKTDAMRSERTDL